MDKKRLCLVIPSLKAGGMERVMSELAAWFCRQDGIEVHLILYGRNPKLFFAVPDNVLVYKPATIFRDKLRFIYTIGRIIFLRRTVGKIKPQSILSFGEYWNSLVMLSLYGLKYPVYLSDRCSPEKIYGFFHTFLRNWLYPQASGIIAQTELAREQYLQLKLNPNIKVIGNPVNSQSIIINDRENIILTVGRLISTKHHDRLIKIFSRIDSNGWKMVIVGGDALKQKNFDRLKKLIDDLKLGNDVSITGELLNVNAYYQKSKLFVFTSSSEGFPNVVAEALAAGLPVVSYDCIAGPSEMIKHGENGFLVPVFNDKMFQKNLQLLIDNEELRNKMSRNARQSIKKFSIGSIGIEYLTFILK